MYYIHWVFDSAPEFVNCTFEEVECPQGRILGAGRCLPRDYICDSVVDCVGGTDEQDCPGYMYRIGLIFVVVKSIPGN